MKTPVILRVFKGNQLIEVKQFDQEQIVIGHDADVHLDLDHESVSPIHCLLEKREDIFYICDLGSRTGTFKNNQQVLDEPMSSGDEIQIGPFKLAFFVGVPKPKASPMAAATQTLTQPKLNTTLNSEISSKPEPKIESKVEPKSVTPEKETRTSVSPNINNFRESLRIPDEKPPVEKETPKTVATSSPKTTTVAKPQIKNSVASANSSKKVSHKTFAPPNQIADLKSFVRPSRGGILEVLVSWKGRVIGSYHFRKSTVVRPGDLELPLGAVSANLALVEIKNGTRVLVSSGMDCEIVGANQRWNLQEALDENKATRGGSSTVVKLEQAEVIYLKLDDDLELVIRYVPITPVVPLMPPLLMSSTEITGLVISLVLVAILGFTISAITPPPVTNQQDDIVRMAQVVFNNPPSKPNPPEVKPPPPPPPPPAEVKPTPPPPPDKAKAADQMREAQKKGKPTDKPAQKSSVAQKAAEVAPIPDSKNKPKKFTSTKQGGAVKIGKEAGANAQSGKDVTKMGLFSAFGGGGTRKKIDEAYSGSGELLGQADKANGTSGMGENREGDDLGSRFKDTGAGGKGTATHGISGVGTKGRANGMSAYGSTEGFGDKTSVNIEPGGAEADFVGTIDREAVRRTVVNNLNQIRGCFVRELNKLDLAGRKSLEGKVIVTWDITAKGIPRNVRIKNSTLNNGVVESCIRDRLATWIFPEPPVGMTAEVSYPFYLRPGN